MYYTVIMKKQQTTIAERLIESQETESAEMSANKQIGDQVKSDYFKCSERFVVYQKKCNAEKKPSNDHAKLEAMTSAVTKMADVLSAQKNTNHGLEKLTVPNWDGSRKNYATWKSEFNYWMKKYKQDKDEQLQRLRKALPTNSFWANQVRPCQTIDQAWKILDTEFGDQRKLMDRLLREITNLKPVKSDSTSLSRYAATILGFVNNMEQIGCEVTNAKEAPFVMSQLLSKLDAKDNIEFGREMHRFEKEENVLNLLDWLNSEASLRSRVRKDVDCHDNSGEHRIPRKFDNRAINSETSDDDVCPLGCEAKHLLAACPKYQRSTIDQRWEIVKQNNRCRKCLRKHHTNVCKKPDGSTCDKCTRRHHRTLHNEQFVPANPSLNPQAAPYTNSMQGASNYSMQGTSNVTGHWAETQASTLNIQLARNVPGQCPVQKVKIKDKDGNLVETLAMLDSGSNTSFISKNVTKKLGLRGPKVHLTMNLAGGQKKSEEAELVNITVVPFSEETIQKPMQVYAINKPCSPAKTVSRRIVNSYPHLEAISNKLYLSGGSIGLLIGTDFPDAFVDIHVIPGSPGEPIAKKNCFGWYVMGRFSDQGDESSAIRTVDVGTVSALEDMTKLPVQDTLGVKPTMLCTCKDNELKENKFIKSIADSTEIVDGKVQVRMPWSEDGPPKESNYDVAYQRMLSSEKTFKRKNCLEDVQDEIQKLLEQEFIVEIKQVDHNVPEWYLPMQAVLTPDRTTKLRLVYDASAKGQNGKSLNDHLEKGPNYINSLPNVLMAWRFDQVAYSGDMGKMVNQVRIHPDDQVFHRFLWRTNESEQPRVYQWVRLNFGDKPAADIAAAAIKTLAKQKALRQQLKDTKKDLLDKNDDVIEKQRKINELYAILENGGKHSDPLKEVIKKLQDDVEIKDGENAKLRKELRLAESKAANFHPTLEDTKENLLVAENEREELKLRVESLSVDIEMRDQALKETQKKEKTKGDMAVYRNKMTRLEAEINQQKRDKDDLEDELNRLENNEANLKRQLQAAWDKQNKDKRKNLEWRKNTLSPLEQELQRAKAQIKNLEKTKSAQVKKIEELQDELDERNDKIAELENELENQDELDAGSLQLADIDFKRDSTALQNVVSERDTALKDLQKVKSKLWSLEHDLDVQKSKDSQQQNLINEVDNLNEKLKDELRQFKRGNLDQQGSQSKPQQEDNKLARQINTLKEDKEDLEKDVEELRAELNPMKKENRTLMLEKKELKLELQKPEVTYLVNSRPPYPSSDGIWKNSPVTPNDLLIGHHFPPPAPEQEERVNPRHLVRCTEKRVQEFWKCWIKYFAPNLLPRNKWYRPRENLQEGDLVLEMEPTPRRTWKLGLVLLTYPGADGLVRKARVKTATSVYDRPIHKLCLIATKEELSNET